MTKIYALLGHPLGHSFSRRFHNDRFAKLGIDAEYINFDLPSIDELPSVMLAHPALCGMNVTIPYKQQVMQFLDELDPEAERIGAVNTIKITHVSPEVSSHIPGLWLKGYNTDIIGFSDSIRPMLQQAGIINDCGVATDDTQSALILGTGGASRAIHVALTDMGIKCHFVSRRPAEGQFIYADLTPEVMASHRVVVNCSPVGMFPHVDEAPDIPYTELTPQHVCYDLIYNPEVTQFLDLAAKQGALTMSGNAMLVGQALAAYQRWTE